MINSLLLEVTNFVFSLGLPVPRDGGAPAATQVTEYVNNISNGGTVTPAPGGFLNSPIMLVVWIAMLAGIWMLMIRPQRKREKKLKELQAGIKTGDNVVTNSGLFGRVADIGTDCFVIEMGISGRTVKVPVLKTDVLGVRDPVLTPPPRESVEG